MTGDLAPRDHDGYVYIQSRVDDLINVAGHRLSTGGIEQIISAHPDVAECAVIGANDALKGEVPVALVCLKSGGTRPEDEIRRDIVDTVRRQLGPVAALKSVGIARQLPKTRSGKILRSAIRQLANGETFATPATIEDPAAIEAVRHALAEIGFFENSAN